MSFTIGVHQKYLKLIIIWLILFSNLWCWYAYLTTCSVIISKIVLDGSIEIRKTLFHTLV